MMPDYPHRVFDTAAATKVAAELNTTDDDGWKYVVKVDPRGADRAVVEVYDEDGNFIGNL